MAACSSDSSTLSGLEHGEGVVTQGLSAPLTTLGWLIEPFGVGNLRMSSSTLLFGTTELLIVNCQLAHPPAVTCPGIPAPVSVPFSR